MATCHICGEEIEFRYIGGRPTPIHLSGRWCSGYSSDARPVVAKPFASVQSYVNPNARCPVCGDRVFYYQSPHGGRVFFDDLGWPWPKHPCTDNPRSQSGTVTRLSQSAQTIFRNREGEWLDLYELDSLIDRNTVVEVRFRRIGENRIFRASIQKKTMQLNKVTVADLRAAPSFVIRTHDDSRSVEFISARKRKIDKIVLSRAKSD